MTGVEARIVLGLEEDEPIYIDGLKYYLFDLENQLACCPRYKSHEKSGLNKKIKAAKKLLELYG